MFSSALESQREKRQAPALVVVHDATILTDGSKEELIGHPTKVFIHSLVEDPL